MAQTIRSAVAFRYDEGMILTVTPNPALDYTIRLDEIEIGKRAKYRDPRIEPAGKGINVSRMVRRLGEPTLALGFAAGATGDLLRRGLEEEGVPHDLVPVSGLTRINVTLLTGAEGSATHLHGPGAGVSTADVTRLLDRVTEQLPRARILVVSGSLPPGMAPGAVADLVAAARRLDVKSIIDAEGETLAAAVAAGADLVKPNTLEIGELLGQPVNDLWSSLAAARDVRVRGAKAVVVTMRGEGAIALSAAGTWHVHAPRENVVRAIGAGDSFAAGLAVGLLRGMQLHEALQLAAAAGTATALHSGTGLGTPEEVSRLLSKTVCRSI
jgi:1-phosphofructokinase family hexose kinase